MLTSIDSAIFFTSVNHKHVSFKEQNFFFAFSSLHHDAQRIHWKIIEISNFIIVFVKFYAHAMDF